MDKAFMAALKEACLNQSAAAIVTITKVKGSTPRKPGTKMLVMAGGATFGTIGGGCGEAEARREALYGLNHVKPVRYVIAMNEDVAAGEGMVCGGTMELLIDVLTPGDTDKQTFFLEYLQAVCKNEAPVMVTITDHAPGVAMAVRGYGFITSTGRKAQYCRDDSIRSMAASLLQQYAGSTSVRYGQAEPYTYLVEPAPADVKMIILGGGHIALPLCSLARIIGYHVTVVDDRPLFASEARFPAANRVICNDFLQAIQSLDITETSYIVIVTRGHRHDKLCLQAVIGQPAAYVGMIGSKRRVIALINELKDEGVCPEALAGVHSPIGIDIGAQTPEEIAVSIMAEVILVHRSGTYRKGTKKGIDNAQS